MAKRRKNQGTARRSAALGRSGSPRSRGYSVGDGEKAFYVAVLTFAVVFTGLIAHGSAFYRRDARFPSASERRATAVARHYDYVYTPRTISVRNRVFDHAMALNAKYDSRPYWRMEKLVVGAPVSPATADLAIEYLIPCESGGQPIEHLDSNGKMSYGILQFQDWDEWQRMSGITGDPENRDDAIRMAEWGIQHGMIDHWGCARILHIM
jgi:hypothetical protein